MNADNHEKLAYESDKIVRYLRGNLIHNENVSLEVWEILDALPFYPTQVAMSEDEFEFKGLNFSKPELRDQIEDSIRLLHEELQEILLDRINQVRISNPDSFDRINGRIQVDDREYPFNPKYSYKISHLTSEYFRKKTGNSSYTLSDLKREYSDEFKNKSNVYKACLAVIPANQAQRKVNCYKMAYLSENDPRYFKTKRDVAVFFRALQLSKYLFMYAGQCIESRVDVMRIFRNRHLYLDPCVRCDNPRIIESYIKSEFDKYSDSSNGPGKKAFSIMSDLNRIIESDIQETLLPEALEYYDLNITP